MKKEKDSRTGDHIVSHKIITFFIVILIFSSAVNGYQYYQYRRYYSHYNQLLENQFHQYEHYIENLEKLSHQMGFLIDFFQNNQ